jgi:ubiquinone biosynthesis UbiH/UbiF/VisC/COQ6 family hydroxylase
MNRMSHNDVIIIGAGPAGLCCAASLADTGLKITVIEKQDESVLKNPPYDGREIALTHLSHKIMSELGMWDVIAPADISLIKNAKVMDGNSPYTLSFHHHEAGKDNLGFMMANNVIRKAAYDVVKKHKNIKLLTGVQVKNVSTDSQSAHVELEKGKPLQAPLVIAADSRFSASRNMMEIKTDLLDFKRTCIVTRMKTEKPHDKTAYECFHYGRTLAVLPLNDSHVSVVITIDSAKDSQVLDLSPEEFARDIEERVDGKLGKMTLANKLYSYPLVGAYAQKFYAQRYALIGDAAVGMHPVTAHGFNLGLRGGYTVAAEIKNALRLGGDIGARSVLQAYDRQHQKVTRPLYAGTNALVKLYTKDEGPARFARRALLRLGNHIRPAKKMIMNQLTEIKSA